MEKNYYTDLACEARDLWRRGQKDPLPGLRTCREQRRGVWTETVEILDQATADELCKPIGRYVTMELDGLFRREPDAFPRTAEVLAAELRDRLALGPEESVLVVCLGNREVTPDAVGPMTAEYVPATRHLKEQLPRDFSAFRPVAVLQTGVLGSTGVESADLAGAVTGLLRPAAVVAVDALAARETGRLCQAVQVSDAGIVPGSGVGNHRGALTRETLGAPVISVGVPTVVDARVLCAGLTGQEPEDLPGGPLFVTPRDIDRKVRDTARLVGCAIDLALHPGLTVEDVEELLS